MRTLLFVAMLLGSAVNALAQTAGTDAGLRMYRDGILPSGEPMTALVAGDVPVVGTQFSCESCHGRSGMGAAEGAYIVPPVAAQFLFVESPQPKRPAYDIDSHARVLRDGVTPSGRALSPELMPRYRLGDDDVAALTAYLATLSSGNSPGVDDKVIRFATVVTEDVDPMEREAVLAVLNKFAEEINRQTRAESERWDRGYTPESRLPSVFREWLIEEWTLSGPPESWSEQLESYYQQQPIFAMLGGLGTGSWRPVSDFCEQQEIPCLFPGTDSPLARDGDFYTLYFSRGLVLEADLIAAHLAAQPVQRVIQIYCDPEVALAVTTLRDSLAQVGTEEETIAHDCREPLPQLGTNDETATVLWLRNDQLSNLPAGRIYVSSTLLGSELSASPLSSQASVFMAHPFRLPGTIDPAMRRFELWAKTRGIDIAAPRYQAQAFFACLALRHALKHMGRFFIRDYVLDMLDHAQNLIAYLPFYPRATLGPGQRFLNKGGYVLPVTASGLETAQAEWILP
jgi:cytochrome c553